MLNRNTFPASLFGVAFIAALLTADTQSHAAMQTFEKEYTYTASELDSKSSCRAIALEQVKRILLQELGVYVESAFNDKASTDGRTKDEVRREITTLSAGVASTEVVEEKWDGTTYWLKARIKADPDDVAKKIEALRQDKQKVAELEESRRKAADLSLELERMRNELDATKSALDKAEQAKQYNDTAQHLSATDWYEKGKSEYFFEASFKDNIKNAIVAYTKAIELNPKYTEAYWARAIDYGLLNDYQRKIEDFNKLIELEPKNPDLFVSRGTAYLVVGDNKQAIRDITRGVKLNTNDWAAYYNRGIAYDRLGDYRRAIKDYSKAIVLKPDAEAYSKRGLAYDKLSDNKRAIEDFKAASRLGWTPAQEILKSQGIQW
ncbi:MAG: tetratricopeptide repeat protein [Nitrospinae bacterium]|nr:tetratricopeptide repeat protein [Nitrospinota bacterium]